MNFRTNTGKAERITLCLAGIYYIYAQIDGSGVSRAVN
jgi:hypothetical protein